MYDIVPRTSRCREPLAEHGQTDGLQLLTGRCRVLAAGLWRLMMQQLLRRGVHPSVSASKRPAVWLLERSSLHLSKRRLYRRRQKRAPFWRPEIKYTRPRIERKKHTTYNDTTYFSRHTLYCTIERVSKTVADRILREKNFSSASTFRLSWSHEKLCIHSVLSSYWSANDQD